MIETSHLSKIFRTEDVETTALKDISFYIKSGEFVAIMGPSGCGKSTLLNLLGLLDSPSSGSIVFDGREISGLRERGLTRVRKGKIGFIFQSFNLIDDLTVYQNVELPLVYQGMGSGSRKLKVTEALRRMNMLHRANHYPQQLSGGQQQRVAIARAVVSKPFLILADEPTGNLDSGNGREVMAMLKELNRDGVTIVMVTHSSDDAENADRIIHLFDGHIVTENIRNAV